MKKIMTFFFFLFSLGHGKSQALGSGNNSFSIRGSDVFSEQKRKFSDRYSTPGIAGIQNPSLQFYQKNKENSSEFFSKFYVKLYGGYSFFTPGSYRVQSSTSVSYKDQNNMPQLINIQTQSRKGMGSGLKFGLGIGYSLNDFLNVGIDAEYQKGDKLSNSLFTIGDIYNYNGTDGEIDYKAITLTPHIIFKALAKPKYFIYNKLGILFTLPFTMHNSGDSIVSFSNSWPANSTDTLSSNHFIYSASYERKYKISLGIGFNVAFGVNFRLGNNVRVFGEIFGNFSALSPSRSNTNSIFKSIDSFYSAIYDYNTSPATLLYYQPLNYKQIENPTINTTYQKAGGSTSSLTYTNGPDPTQLYYIQTVRDQKFTINMNSIGINFGIIYRFK